MLSRREHSRLELARKLAPHSENHEALEHLLDDLTREGWLSDERFAQSLVHRRARTHGEVRIVDELRQSGVSDDTIVELRESLRDTEFDRAKAAWQKKFGPRHDVFTDSVAADPASAMEEVDEPTDANTPDRRARDRAAYAKQARFLAGRGFRHDVIARVLGADRSDDD